MRSETEDSTKNDFSSNLIAMIPDLTIILVLMVLSTNSMKTELLIRSYSGIGMLKKLRKDL